MKIRLFPFFLIFFVMNCRNQNNFPTTVSNSDLSFTTLAQNWDEGMPLGNGVIGALVWEKEDALRLSLDRTDLWDLRPTDSISGKNNRFAWVKEQIRKNDYLPVQQKFDWPYDQLPAPSKIPGAALEFPILEFGEVEEVRLYLNNALCEITWKNGIIMKTFVHATKPIGWFMFENLNKKIIPRIIPPRYNNTESNNNQNLITHGHDLRRLGYEQGHVTQNGNHIVYHQKGWEDYFYDVSVQWEQKGSSLHGVWSITSSLCPEQASQETETALQRGAKQDYQTHLDFWKQYWEQSSVTLPESLLQKQYDNEMYKFGSAARENSYPISLQSVWTADNGNLPPWKGDFHHDLNTQLSYWPAYIGNHLTEGMGYLNTLWNQREVYKKYTRQYFETEGMNIPGVCTLTGEPMGGWIQYAMSPTCGAWLAQHFYLHWKYSADKTFLEERAYPFLKDVAVYMEQISEVNEKGIRTLEFSSSPEIFNNSIEAWFTTITNYDLALMKFIFKATAEAAEAMGLATESLHWAKLKKQLPSFDIDERGALTFANGYPYEESHRHFSHAMAIHPLGLIDYSEGKNARKIVDATLQCIQDHGTTWWTGYSFSWFANMKARALDGEGAAEALRTFAQCFCLRNTFHANGDQTNSGISQFTYSPFTLEGNFAFAAGIQEMLLQSHTGIIRIFPAIPSTWKDVAFDKLRAMGGFLVSAEKKEGKTVFLRIFSEHGNSFRLYSPITNNVVEFKTRKGEWMEIPVSK